VIPFASGELTARRWKSFENLVCLKEIGSSSDLARELMELYFGEDQKLVPTVILAESQTRARGRKGDPWRAPAKQGIYFTFVRPAAPHEPLSLVPIAVARWIRDAILDATRVSAVLKWPNDLYVGRKKLAGVIAESRTQGEDTYIAVGLGLNVAGRGSDLGVDGATTVSEEAGRPISLAPLAQAILDRLDRELTDPHWQLEVERWEKSAAHHPGDCLTIRQGESELTGEYRGLSPEGFLRLGIGSGETVIATGELAKW
jgi:BirA family transcriptional regulator, biotin operon repressor / biotin---[acetyl-CoA-carboxylase] ligase